MFVRVIIKATLVAALLAGCANVSDNDFTTSGISGIGASASSQPTGAEVVPPFGHIGFCLRNPKDCRPENVTGEKLKLTYDKWIEINHVNDKVNRTVTPVDDEVNNEGRAEFWDYPSARGGDCEDYALLKRKMLLDRGYSSSSLLLATVKQWDGAGHAVLIVSTDRGDFVLDNQQWQVKSWADSPYTFISRQSKWHPYVWVNLEDSRQTTKMVHSEPRPKNMNKRDFP